MLTTHHGMMDPIEKWEVRSYQEELGANIRAERARAGLSQRDVADRMRALGFPSWLYQTAGSSERATRRVTAQEILGLALALGTTVAALMRAGATDHLVTYPGFAPGHTIRRDAIGACTVSRLAWGVSDSALRWDGARIAGRYIASYDQGATS